MSLPWDELRGEYARLIAHDMAHDRIPAVCQHALLLQIAPMAALGLLEDSGFCSLVDVLEDHMRAHAEV